MPAKKPMPKRRGQHKPRDQAKKDTAPVGFRAAVGAHVPDSIKLEPLPKAVVELVPRTVDYEYAFVANQVLIVEPRSRTVVEVIH